MEQFKIIKNIKQYNDHGDVLNIRKNLIQMHRYDIGWWDPQHTEAFACLEHVANYIKLELGGNDVFCFKNPFMGKYSYSSLCSIRVDVKDILI